MYGETISNLLMVSCQEIDNYHKHLEILTKLTNHLLHITSVTLNFMSSVCFTPPKTPDCGKRILSWWNGDSITTTNNMKVKRRAISNAHKRYSLISLESFTSALLYLLLVVRVFRGGLYWTRTIVNVKAHKLLRLERELGEIWIGLGERTKIDNNGIKLEVASFSTTAHKGKKLG